MDFVTSHIFGDGSGFDFGFRVSTFIFFNRILYVFVSGISYVLNSVPTVGISLPTVPHPQNLTY
jgi:hypothetical protein